MRYAIFLVVLLQPPAAVFAQESVMGCIAPSAPETALPHDLLREYRSELIIEFEQYFRDISRYIACLDAERAAALEEARQATEAYVEFLRVATKDENR